MKMFPAAAALFDDKLAAFNVEYKRRNALSPCAPNPSVSITISAPGLDLTFLVDHPHSFNPPEDVGSENPPGPGSSETAIG